MSAYQIANARIFDGTEAGALADLLLVDGDPLADIAILQDRDAIRLIMKDGALHKAA